MAFDFLGNWRKEEEEEKGKEVEKEVGSEEDKEEGRYH